MRYKVFVTINFGVDDTLYTPYSEIVHTNYEDAKAEYEKAKADEKVIYAKIESWEYSEEQKEKLHELNITRYLIDNVFRNEEYYMLHDEETLNDMIWDLMEIIASLHNEYYKAVHGEYYDYMFHWVNKMNCGTIIDDIFKEEK